MTWRLFYVRPQSESRYQASLAERGWPSYVPKEVLWRGIGVRRKPTPKPLLPGYVFADLTDEQLADAAHLPEVLYLVKHVGRVAEVPSEFVEALQTDEAKGRFDRTRKAVREARMRGKPLAPGQTFTVTAGVYEGHIGRIDRVTGNQRAEVLLDAIGATPKPISLEFAHMQAIVEDETIAA